MEPLRTPSSRVVWSLAVLLAVVVLGASDGPRESVAHALPPAREPGPSDPPAFECLGAWSGPMRATSGPTGVLTARIRSTRGRCGTFEERWTGLNTCHYQMERCSQRGASLVARAAAPSHERRGGGCNPVAVRFTCSGSVLRFREDAPRTVVTATLRRAR